MKNYALIVAGGSGSRMQSEIPKQFLLLNGQPVLMHTLKAFYEYDKSLFILLILPENQMALWEKLVNKFHFKIPHKVIKGGKSRSQSVHNGLNAIKENGLVAIHDGVRPLVSDDIIKVGFEQAAVHGNATAAVFLKDSIRKVHKNENKTVNREEFRSIQTPQTFNVKLIKEAFSQANPNKIYTDDASVLEDMGEKIVLIEGSYENIKITTPEDLVLAESILKLRK